MARYLCLFVTHADDVFGSEFMDAETDQAAVARALTIHRNGIGKGFELWRDDQLVYASNGPKA
jgi:hypothetical protein